MSIDSNVAILYDVSGNPLAVQSGAATPASTPGVHILGAEGSNSRYIAVDSSGNVIVVGAGVAGTPAGGVVSIQGVAGGTTVPVSGTVTATNASIGTNGAAAPASSTQVGGSDGTNLQAARVFDLDSGGGTEYSLSVNLRISQSGGSIEAKGQKTMANSIPVVVASDQSAIQVTSAKSATGTTSTVASSATNVTLLSSNASRLGATIVNESTKKVFIKAGTTATASDYSWALLPGDTLDVPFSYTGRIDAIWAAANGNARITEFT